MSFPKVSVIICTYNQFQFISETIESVLAQTYPSIEIIVADDASTDGTKEILRELEQKHTSKIVVIYGEKNLGIPSNINRALELAKGQYVAWLDGDDLMLPQKIQLQVELLEAAPESCGCYHDATVFDSKTGHEYGSFALLYNGTKKMKQGSIYNTLFPRYFALPSTTMCRRQFIPASGFDARLAEFSEFLFFTEVFVHGDVLTLDQALTRYRRHSKNLTADENFRQRSLENELIAYGIITARYPQLANRMNRFRISSLLTQSVYCARKCKTKDSIHYLMTTFVGGAPLRALLVAFICLFYILMSKFSKKDIDQVVESKPYQRKGYVQKLIKILLG